MGHFWTGMMGTGNLYDKISEVEDAIQDITDKINAVYGEHLTAQELYKRRYISSILLRLYKQNLQCHFLMYMTQGLQILAFRLQ